MPTTILEVMRHSKGTSTLVPPLRNIPFSLGEAKICTQEREREECEVAVDSNQVPQLGDTHIYSMAEKRGMVSLKTAPIRSFSSLLFLSGPKSPS